MILKTDARNAFNSISRSSFLKEVAESFPSLYKFVARCYFLLPALCFQQKMNIKCILSEEGVQQGDPLGPFLFALALQPCLRAAAEECSKGFVVSYLDDAVIVGPKADVLSAYEVLQDKMASIGLEIRPDKCEALSQHEVGE